MANMGTAPALLLLCLYSVRTHTAHAQSQNFEVPWSKKKFGPDGPWQAVIIIAGGNSTVPAIDRQNTTELAVFPGGTWQSMTFTPDACESYPDTLCGSGGTWVPDEYQARQQPVYNRGNWTDGSTGIQVEDADRVILGITINGRTAFNSSLISASSGNVTYPNGKVGGVTLDNLALGADNVVQEFGTDPKNKSQAIVGYLYAGWLYENQMIPSYSYGLHIGSAAFDYPGSLIFGGYDKGRIIEPVTVFSNEHEVLLQDISIDVATGSSPFNFTSRRQLLSTGPMDIWPDPLAPYLSLPRETCDNLASVLPVTFDKTLQYYLWNTEDANYRRIVSSPTYLGFTFPAPPGANENVIIKVPFAFLNLTLEAPITDAPKQYFPCVPTKFEYKLGRAFLQAAFIGRNWGTQTSWLAQAPGPGPARQGLGLRQHVNIDKDTRMIQGYPQGNRFVESWSGQWSLLESQQGGSNRTNETPVAHGEGLSTGTKAGIGIGAALGAVAVLAGLLVWWWKHSAKHKSAHSRVYEACAEPTLYQQDGKAPSDCYALRGYNGENDAGPTVELPHTPKEPVELGDTSSPDQRNSAEQR